MSDLPTLLLTMLISFFVGLVVQSSFSYEKSQIRICQKANMSISDCVLSIEEYRNEE